MSAPSRLVVLGLDGMGLETARALTGLASLPGLARICREAGAMRAELPELSPVNWTSFFTARGPEHHGVFGFARLDPGTYDLALADFTHVAVPTIFDVLADAGFVSRVLNLPTTYPARPFGAPAAPGGAGSMLVSGFVAPDLARACHPRPLAAVLAAQGYATEPDTARGAWDHAGLLAGLSASLKSRRRALDLMWSDLAWDCFVFVLTETDRLFHFLLPAALDPGHPEHAACMEVVRDVDGVIRDCLERLEALEPRARLLVLADHGFAPTRMEADVNAWLAGQGYLARHRPPAGEHDLAAWAHPGTRALALDPGRIYVHTRERFARGGVAPKDREAVCGELARELAAWRLDGEPVLAAVHRARDLYPGPMLAAAPDLVLEPAPGISLTAKFDGRGMFGRRGRQGCHRADGAIFYDSRGRGARPERVRDVGRLVLDHFGLDLPHDEQSPLLAP